MHNNPALGARYLIRGIGLLTQPRIRRYVLIPLCVNVVLFLIFGYSMFLGVEWLTVKLESMLPEWLDWLTYLLWPIYLLSALLIPVFGFVIVANLIASPFNGLLAEAVEQHLSGKLNDTPFSWRGLMGEMRRTIGSELRKLRYTLARMLPLLILLWIPGLNLIGSVLWVGFGAWLMAIQYADYPMGNHALSFPEQKALLAERKLLSLGFGASVMLAMMVPIVNFVVMPASVAGATALWVDIYSKSTPNELAPPPQA